MKSTLLTIVGLAAAVAAQSAGDLPQCGQTCAGNMVSAEKSEELGCDTGDLGCLCTNQNFVYGLRDCSLAICNEEQAAQVLQYGLEVCRQAGVKITTGASGTVSATATGTGAVRTVFSTIVSGDTTLTSAVSTISGTGGSETEGDVSTYTSVFTNSDGDVVTTTGETTVGAGAASVTTFTSDGTEIVRTLETETATGDDEDVTTFTSGGTVIISTKVTKTATEEAEVTTFTTDGTEVVRTLTTKTVSTGSETGSASETVTDATTATETEGSTETGESGTATGDASETTSTSGNAAVPQMTAAPAGILAAAGLAMFLL
ncbi:hypothetical protein FDECE_17402 [Fusarium decemcellulare]|nr:hypothetical protein FDECE_17402 [Fusarium decemcellulare]